jgi:DNA-binding NtrC family response regulator
VRAAVPREPQDREPQFQVNLREATAEFERAHILRVIEQCGGNKRKAAKLLGLGVTSLYRKLGAAVAPADESPA